MTTRTAATATIWSATRSWLKRRSYPLCFVLGSCDFCRQRKTNYLWLLRAFLPNVRVLPWSTPSSQNSFGLINRWTRTAALWTEPHAPAYLQRFWLAVTTVLPHKTKCSPVPDPTAGVGLSLGSGQPAYNRIGRENYMSWDEINGLVLKAQQGDRAAYGELVERSKGPSTRWLSNGFVTRWAQELAQEVFIHAMKKLPQLREPRCFAGWLRRITARMAINRMSRNGNSNRCRSRNARSGWKVAVLLRAKLWVRRNQSELLEGLKRLKALDVKLWKRSTCVVRACNRWAVSSPLRSGTIKRRLHVARCVWKKCWSKET